MTNRRTSVYTIRLQSQEAVAVTAYALREQGIGVIDQGDQAVSFRTTDDAAALLIARQVPAWSGETVTLTTGLGVHRRTVEG